MSEHDVPESKIWQRITWSTISRQRRVAEDLRCASELRRLPLVKLHTRGAILGVDHRVFVVGHIVGDTRPTWLRSIAVGLRRATPKYAEIHLSQDYAKNRRALCIKKCCSSSCFGNRLPSFRRRTYRRLYATGSLVKDCCLLVKSYTRFSKKIEKDFCMESYYWLSAS